MSIEAPAPDCWYLTGPTASGKTPISIALAGALGAEIVSLDSMALYRGMNIGTAKPPAAEQRRMPHHLIDIIEPEEEFSVARYVEAAVERVQDIRSRGKEALFVGGTPLYLKALLRGIFEGPEADWEFRREVEDELQRVGSRALHERLEQVDPLSAARLHPNDTRRIIRALEVYTLTGQPISHLQMQFEEGQAAEECRVFVLKRRVSELHERIDRRVEAMFAAGLVEEVRGLLEQGRELSRTARQAVGYREVLEHLDGAYELQETIERVKVRTRRFAKRQRTWFRSLSECRFVPIAGDPPPGEVAETILQMAAG